MARLQQFRFLRPSPGRTFHAEGEAKKGRDNDAGHKGKKDYDGKRRAKFPHKKRNRDRCCILNGKNDNGCYNEDCTTENKHERPPYSFPWSALPLIRPHAHRVCERDRVGTPSAHFTLPYLPNTFFRRSVVRATGFVRIFCSSCPTIVKRPSSAFVVT